MNVPLPRHPSPAKRDPTDQSPPLEVSCSRDFIPWLAAQPLSLAFTTYQTCRLFLLGLKPDGRLSIFERLFDHAMGLWADPEQLVMATRFQLWRFYNVLAQGENYRGYDRLYVPRLGHTTGDLDVHDVALDMDDKIVYVSTLYSCLATLSERYGFKPFWKPPFISELVAEDRCHLNGMAMENGRPRYVTSVSRSDVYEGWRERRHDGGVVIDVSSNEIVASGLSMPHSPRLYNGKLWVLNSGTGEFGFIDREAGKFEPVTFCPGYLRGLAFYKHFAIVGLSKPRKERAFKGLALDDRLREKDSEARCGLMVIDINAGRMVHWVDLQGVVIELYDVQALPGVVRPQALGFRTDEIRRVISIESADSEARHSVTLLDPAE
jgi:uncharacterized protein (TIGR03032 family)